MRRGRIEFGRMAPSRPDIAGRTRSSRTAGRGRCRGRAPGARGPSARRAPSPRCRARRSPPARGRLGRPRAAPRARAPAASDSTQRILTRTRLATPAWRRPRRRSCRRRADRVLADHRDLHLVPRMEDRRTISSQAERSVALALQAQLSQIESSSPRRAAHERDLVDRVARRRLDDRLVGTCRTARSSRAHRRRNLASAEQDVGLDPDFAQLCTLCWVGLVFSSPAASMYGTNVRCTKRARAAELEAQLPDRLQEGQATRCPRPSRRFPRCRHRGRRAAARMTFDLVGDVRDHLHRLAEEVAAPLAEDPIVDLPGREVVAARHGDR